VEKLDLKPKRTHILSFSFLLAYSFFLFILAGCAAYHPVAVNEVPFKQHSQTQVDGNVRVTAAVLMNQENEQIFGFDLALRWVQAVWVEVENRDNHNYWLLSSALDPDYYSPNEIAYSGHRWLSLGVNDKIDARFKQLGFRNPIPPGSVVSGFFFVNLDQDNKEVDIDLISRVHKKFLTFYFQIPGLRANTMFDVERKHSQQDVVEVDEKGLRKALEDLPCCTTSKDGQEDGDPYFTDGLLLVLLFDRRPISVLEVQFFDWEKPVGRHM